jgi:hypothetical protein
LKWMAKGELIRAQVRSGLRIDSMSECAAMRDGSYPRMRATSATNRPTR